MQPSPDHSLTINNPGQSTAVRLTAVPHRGYEVRVMSVCEGNRHTRPPSAGDTAVNIVSCGQSGRPIVLVFASYVPVNQDSQHISKNYYQ